MKNKVDKIKRERMDEFYRKQNSHREYRGVEEAQQ